LKVEHDVAEPTDQAFEFMVFCAKQFKRLANGGCLIVIDAQASPSLSYAKCRHIAGIDQQALEILIALAIHLYLLR
jgi:hypothetical protein